MPTAAVIVLSDFPLRLDAGSPHCCNRFAVHLTSPTVFAGFADSHRQQRGGHHAGDLHQRTHRGRVHGLRGLSALVRTHVQNSVFSRAHARAPLCACARAWASRAPGGRACTRAAQRQQHECNSVSHYLCVCALTEFSMLPFPISQFSRVSLMIAPALGPRSATPLRRPRHARRTMHCHAKSNLAGLLVAGH